MVETEYGFLNIKKPVGVTAHDVVAKVRRILRIKQVGHGGTLDPLASGVLPIAIGKATRLLRFLDGTKVYLAEIRLGLQTTTDDLEGDALKTSEEFPSSSAVSERLLQFVGHIEQLPPLYSAVHVNGKRLYEMARAGETPESIPVRSVFVAAIEELGYAPPVVRVRITCGPGTYIRSIARDLGEKLGCGGCLQALVREQAGPFRIENSLTLEDLQAAVSENRLAQVLDPPQRAITLSQIQVPGEQALKLRLGQPVEISLAEVPAGQEHIVAMFDDKIVAICRWDSEAGVASVKIQPEVVLADGQTNK